jgi:hypothetical protein
VALAAADPEGAAAIDEIRARLKNVVEHISQLFVSMALS